MSWFIGVLLLLIIVLTIVSCFKKRKTYKIILSIILIVFFAYSFFTYNGATRLGITLTTGDAISAYTTKLEKGFSRGNNNKYFHPTKDIKVTSGSMYDMECKSYLMIKICTYYGF